MEKPPPPSNPKIRANRSTKNKKTTKQPLKVVYIANPIKFTASASEFRALVQEHTGQNAADTPPPSPAGTTAAWGGGGAGKGASESNVHAEVVVQKESDPYLGSGGSAYGGVFVPPHHEMMESYKGTMDSSDLFDVLKSLDAM